MLLRRISEHLRSQNWVAVALDFIIVVAGVLIAFQVTNWDLNRRESKAAQSYIKSISRNIAFDLERLDTLRQRRVGSLNLVQGSSVPREVTPIDLTTIRTASEAFRSLSDYEYFNADRSGFESLKSSGLLSSIQGDDIESLIFAYYNLADQIALDEADYNEFLKEAFRAFDAENFEHIVYIIYPDYIDGEAQLAALQVPIREILTHPTAESIFRYVYEEAPELIIMYDNIEMLGREIVSMASDPKRQTGNSSRAVLNNLFDINGNQGYPFVMLNGVLVDRFYELGLAAANGAAVETSAGFSQIDAEFPDVEWAVFYLRNRSSPFAERPAKDFSEYEAVRVTLKGANGNETLMISMKDSTDPDDGLESRVSLTLNADWTTYEIPLSAFPSADLENIFVPLQFIFENTAAEISIKDLEFIRTFDNEAGEEP